MVTTTKLKETFIEIENDLFTSDADGWYSIREEQSNITVHKSVRKQSLDKVDYYKIISFFIKDLLKSIKEDDHYLIRNNPFVFVQIFGTILSVTPVKDKWHLEVHDGTGCITCVLDGYVFKNNEYQLESIHTYINNNNGHNGTLFQAAMMTFRSLKHLSKSVPDRPESVKPSDIVQVEGKLSEYNGKWYVFINKLVRKNIDDLIENLEYQKSFYKNYLT